MANAEPADRFSLLLSLSSHLWKTESTMFESLSSDQLQNFLDRQSMSLIKPSWVMSNSSRPPKPPVGTRHSCLISLSQRKGEENALTLHISAPWKTDSSELLKYKTDQKDAIKEEKNTT